jgi:hypothetical protein
MAFLQKPRLICLALSLMFFWISLLTPAIEIIYHQGHRRGEVYWVYGIYLLLEGWLAIIFMRQFAWLANVTLAMGWVTLACNWRIAAGILAGLSILLSFHTLEMYRIPIPGADSPMNSQLLNRLGLGFFLWNLSMVLVILGALLERKKA